MTSRPPIVNYREFSRESSGSLPLVASAGEGAALVHASHHPSLIVPIKERAAALNCVKPLIQLHFVNQVAAA